MSNQPSGGRLMTLATLRARRADLALELARLDAEITAEIAPLLRLPWPRYGVGMRGQYAADGRWMSVRAGSAGSEWTAHGEQGHECTEAEAMLAAERVAGIV